jgi:hypothetical protein
VLRREKTGAYLKFAFNEIIVEIEFIRGTDVQGD